MVLLIRVPLAVVKGTVMATGKLLFAAYVPVAVRWTAQHSLPPRRRRSRYLLRPLSPAALSACSWRWWNWFLLPALNRGAYGEVGRGCAADDAGRNRAKS